MGMTPDQFFYSFVQGNHWDFAKNPDSVRHGFNAAVAASHMADHFFKYCRRHEPEKVACFANFAAYLAYLDSETRGAFKAARSIANAYKHLYVGSDKHSVIDSGGCIECVVLDEPDEPIAELEVERPAVGEPCVIYRDRGGKVHSLLETLSKVVTFWESVFLDY